MAHTFNDIVTITLEKEVNKFLGVAEDDPCTYHEAAHAYDAEKWEMSYDDKLASMCHHGIWTLYTTHLLKGCKILGIFTVFLNKNDKHNNVCQWKTRIVAKGYSQIEGVDYTNTFAPMAHLKSVPTVLGLVASMDWVIH